MPKISRSLLASAPLITLMLCFSSCDNTPEAGDKVSSGGGEELPISRPDGSIGQPTTAKDQSIPAASITGVEEVPATAEEPAAAEVATAPAGPPNLFVSVPGANTLCGQVDLHHAKVRVLDVNNGLAEVANFGDLELGSEASAHLVPGRYRVFIDLYKTGSTERDGIQVRNFTVEEGDEPRAITVDCNDNELQ